MNETNKKPQVEVIKEFNASPEKVFDALAGYFNNQPVDVSTRCT